MTIKKWLQDNCLKNKMENKKVQNLIEKIRSRQPEEYTDKLGESEAWQVGFPFMYELCQAVNGHTGITYTYRKDQTELERLREDWENNGHSGTVNKVHYGYVPDQIVEETRDSLSKLLKDGLVVDLGCGYHGNGYALANSLGASGYIGVDSDLAKSANEACREIRGEIPYVIAQSDMNSFLRNFKEEDIKARAVFFSGIENTSYNGASSYESIFNNIADSLEDSGKVIVGGNLGWFENDCGDAMGKRFEKSGILRTKGSGDFILWGKTGGETK